MAVVKTEQVFFNGVFIKRKISCNSNGEFSATLPSELVKRLGVRAVITGSSLQQVEHKWGEMVSKFNDSNTSSRKVILCSFNADASIFRDGETVYSGRGHFHESGIEISFSAGVFIETTVRFDGKDRLSYVEEESSIPSSVNIISTDLFRGSDGFIKLDWTQDREAAIADLAVSFENLIIRMIDIFGTSDKLLEVIANHQKLLPG